MNVQWQVTRHEIVDTAVTVAIDDAGEDVGEVGLWIDAVQLACFDQRRDGGPVFGASVRTSEE